jgi:hypothetical protein
MTRLLFAFLLCDCATSQSVVPPIAAPELEPLPTAPSSNVSKAWEPDAVPTAGPRTGLVGQADLGSREVFETSLQSARRAMSGQKQSEALESIEGAYRQALSAADVKIVERLRTQYRQTFAKLKGATQCLIASEKSKRVLPCGVAAMAVSEEFGDEEATARFQVLRALENDEPEKKMSQLRRLQRTCSTSFCALGQAQVARKLVELAVQSKPEWALAALVHEQAQWNAVAPLALRFWTRSANWNAACPVLERTSPGQCRTIEKQKLESLTYVDFSLQNAGEGLGPNEVKTVNAHYGPTLDNCLSEQARRMSPPDSQAFQLNWIVGNDGLVKEAHLRKDLDETLLALCLRKQFALWRYPKFSGEFQNVEQTFTVTATQRR